MDDNLILHRIGSPQPLRCGSCGRSGARGADGAEGQIAYESSLLSKLAALFRLTRGKLDRPELLDPDRIANVAVFEYETPHGARYKIGTNVGGGTPSG
jgi:hypothetical protein